ncbi:flagellar basal body L-ring protein FlgH [Thermodesulfovibrionales bacterium]|nr:flagellar basal body L-ring protein FlgH [Thermodesulfovibrionales bacterium]MCL0083219.1 flagellar basal body L-ring protein FlgH [Thermodesulfovibrionales bacterium]
MKTERSEVLCQRRGERLPPGKAKRLLLLTVYGLIFTMLVGCAGLRDAHEVKIAPMPPMYTEVIEEREVHAPEGSLWVDNAFLFRDRRARAVNDLVTIVIHEVTRASKRAETGVERDALAEYRIGPFVGENPLFCITGIPFDIAGISIGGEGRSAFEGSGDTIRQGRLESRITAIVIDVLPNSNLVIESRREIIVNDEKEILVLRGIVRPDDISPNNTVLSTHIANAQIYMVGVGVLGDRQRPGWLMEFLDRVWPF